MILKSFFKLKQRAPKPLSKGEEPVGIEFLSDPLLSMQPPEDLPISPGLPASAPDLFADGGTVTVDSKGQIQANELQVADILEAAGLSLSTLPLETPTSPPSASPQPAPQLLGTVPAAETIIQKQPESSSLPWPDGLFQQRPGVKMAAIGRVEVLSTEFAMGWAAAARSGAFAHVLAVLDGEVIGAAVARFGRVDLDRARSEGTMDAYAFVVVFTRKVEPDRVRSITIVSPGAPAPLLEAREVKSDRTPILRVFLFGSPRSGTSELGTTLTNVLGIPWMGEGHAAPLFSSAADALKGDPDAPNGMVRFMGKNHLRDIAVEAAKQAYFINHASSSFLDKTPGMPMITAAPFLLECFPDAKFIFLQRNPIANILSRMVKFGGNFQGHCRDWNATMMEWLKVRSLLPHYLEISQEEMASAPQIVADKISIYLGEPEGKSAVAASLSSGNRERTGAGFGKSKLAETGWSPNEIDVFLRTCSPAIEAYGYEFDSDGSLQILRGSARVLPE